MQKKLEKELFKSKEAPRMKIKEIDMRDHDFILNRWLEGENVFFFVHIYTRTGILPFRI